VHALPGIFHQLQVIEDRLASQSPTTTHLSFKLTTHYLVPSSSRPIFPCFNPTLSALQARLASAERIDQRILTLTGVACGGKTRAALDFCLRAKTANTFGAIFWVNSYSPASIEKSFNNIANTVNVPKSNDTAARVQTMLAVLASWPTPWLIILDNYHGERFQKDLGRYIVACKQGNYLVTRKIDKMSDEEKVRAVCLPDLGLQDAVELLFYKCGLEKSDENFEVAVQLVRTLGKRPRDVSEAAKVMKQRKLGLKDYLKILNQKEKEKKKEKVLTVGKGDR
jgi:hypothetical protein